MQAQRYRGTAELVAAPRPALVAAEQAGAIVPADVPWQRVLESFLRTQLDSPHSVRAYRRYCTRALDWLEVRSLSEVNGEMLGEYRHQLMTDPALAPKTVAHALDVLRSFLQWASQLGAFPMDVGLIKRMLKTPKGSVVRPYKLLKSEELDRFWAAAAQRPLDYAACCVWLGAGLRVSEVAALRVQDCYADLEGGPALKVNQGKGAKDRLVPMRPAYFAGIMTYLAATGRTLQSPGRLFVAEDGAAASRSNSRSITSCGLQAALGRIFRRAGMDWRGRGPHSLRHTFAITALREGGNVVAVMKLLGHANLNTTMTYVNHLDLKELREGLPSGGPPVAAAPAVPAGALTIEQSAQLLGVHRDVVRSLLRRHELTGSAGTHRWYIDPDSVAAYGQRLQERPS